MYQLTNVDTSTSIYNKNHGYTQHRQVAQISRLMSIGDRLIAPAHLFFAEYIHNIYSLF
jgi:hypothetical protein